MFFSAWDRQINFISLLLLHLSWHREYSCSLRLLRNTASAKLLSLLSVPVNMGGDRSVAVMGGGGVPPPPPPSFPLGTRKVTWQLQQQRSWPSEGLAGLLQQRPLPVPPAGTEHPLGLTHKACCAPVQCILPVSGHQPVMQAPMPARSSRVRACQQAA